MTDTIISSATKEVAIGFGRPFIMIGERINPTGRKLLAEEMKNGDFSRVVSDAIAQVEAGAPMLDVNAGIPLADEPALLVRDIQEVQAVTAVPIAIDSSIVEALEAAIEIYEGKPLINSVTGEEEVLERVLPFVAKHGAAVVAISNDETGISEDPNVRFEVAKKIVNRAADFGIPAADVRHIRKVAFQLLLILVPQRHFPGAIARILTGGHQVGRQAVVIREQTSGVVTESNHTSAGQCRDVDDRGRLVALRVGECITENEPAFRISVQYLDSLTRHAGDDVSGLGGVTVR